MSFVNSIRQNPQVQWTSEKGFGVHKFIKGPKFGCPACLYLDSASLFNISNPILKPASEKLASVLVKCLSYSDIVNGYDDLKKYKKLSDLWTPNPDDLMGIDNSCLPPWQKTACRVAIYVQRFLKPLDATADILKACLDLSPRSAPKTEAWVKKFALAVSVPLKVCKLTIAISKLRGHPSQKVQSHQFYLALEQIASIAGKILKQSSDPKAKDARNVCNFVNSILSYQNTMRVSAYKDNTTGLENPDPGLSTLPQTASTQALTTPPQENKMVDKSSEEVRVGEDKNLPTGLLGSTRSTWSCSTNGSGTWDGSSSADDSPKQHEFTPEVQTPTAAG